MATKKPLSNQTAQIKLKEITEEMKESYIDYAMSVIVSRALPDVRDGLKPVQRRILFAMYEMGLSHRAKFRKSAATVGEVLAKFHPHGDIPVYDALTRMAQDFSLRYPLIEGQGNFGSIDGDPPAAMRYTEAKLSEIGEEMLRDIEKETVDFVPNYDGTRKEPTVLPSPIPQLIINGALGIAVGMATNIPPHNLSEVCEALSYLIDHPKATVKEISKFIKGPDFPTGGLIFDKESILQAYSQGKGPILIRGKAEIIETKSEKFQIIISEIPFQVQKSSLLEQFANLINTKKIEGVRDIRDESDKEGMRIVIKLQKDASPKKILNLLYKFSDLEKCFHLNMLALVDGIQPRALNLIELLNYFLLHREEVVIKRTKYELEKAKERAHILEGLSKCLGKIDLLIRTIRNSSDRETAKVNLMKKFKLTEIQANAILETRLSSLARLERKRIETELKEMKSKIKELTLILKTPQKIKEIIKKELREIKERFGDKRKTQVIPQPPKKIKEEDLIPSEDTIITLTQDGYVKRVNPTSYKTQKRGGKGTFGMKIGEKDIVEHCLLTNTRDNLFFFTDSGRVFKIPAYEIPQLQKNEKGKSILNFLELSSKEKVLSLLSLGKRDFKERIKYLIFVTREGLIKKTPLKEFENVRKNGLIAISLKKGDLLKKVQKSNGESELLLITKKGQIIRIKEKEIRAMGRTAGGIRGIKLVPKDEIIGMEVINRNHLDSKSQILFVTEKGYGKRVFLKEFKIQKRGGIGIRGIKITEKTGFLVSGKILTQKENLIVISKRGKIIRIEVNSLPIQSRSAQGVKIMKLEKEDTVGGIISL